MALSKNDKRAALVLTAVAVFVLFVLAVVFYQRYTRPFIGQDNCIYSDDGLRQKLPSDQTVVLIDQSEALAPGHIRGVQRYLEGYILDDDQASTGARFLIFAFSRDDFPERGQGTPDFRPLTDLCKPRQKGNPLSENNRRLREKFARSFLQPLTASLAKELTKEVGQRSPILETLQFISRSQEIGAWNKQKTLIIVSDMLQHTQGFSHYRSPNGYQEFKKRYAQQVSADYRDWNVVILYLRRYHDRRLQQDGHLEFWQRYFADYGGKLKRVEGFD